MLNALNAVITCVAGHNTRKAALPETEVGQFSTFTCANEKQWRHSVHWEVGALNLWNWELQVTRL